MQRLFRPDNLASMTYGNFLCCLSEERAPTSVDIRSNYPEKLLVTLVKNEEFFARFWLWFFASCLKVIMAITFHFSQNSPDKVIFSNKYTPFSDSSWTRLQDEHLGSRKIFPQSWNIRVKTQLLVFFSTFLKKIIKKNVYHKIFPNSWALIGFYELHLTSGNERFMDHLVAKKSPKFCCTVFASVFISAPTPLK